MDIQGNRVPTYSLDLSGLCWQFRAAASIHVFLYLLDDSLGILHSGEYILQNIPSFNLAD